MNLAGISNENEFFSDHYLAEVFIKDTKETLDVWLQREKDAKLEATTGQPVDPWLRAPYNQLSSLSADYTFVRRTLERARSPEERLEIQRDWLATLCRVFDLPYAPQQFAISDELVLPLISAIDDHEGNPLLWLLEVLPGSELDEDPLSLTPLSTQLTAGSSVPLPTPMQNKSWQALLIQSIFSDDTAPRWIILASATQWLLLDRAKFAQNRLIRFDWQEILSRRELDTLKAVAVLMHRDSLIGEQGQSLIDSLDDNSHKHAYGVSEDLKYALRESIELLGNEAARQLVDQAKERKEGIYSGKHELDATQLSTECLRYMYRLLFLFYIEARPELGYAPVGNPVYLKGYSLESLRELEMVELTNEREQQGRFINDTINVLFRLIDVGLERPAQTTINAEAEAFELPALKSHLFDPARTSTLNSVVFPNVVLLRVIKLMSLTRQGTGRRRRGRVSYAQLGINQLGAVYEALLSFRGFFATEDLYEVKKAGESPNELETGYFVNADALADYEDDEKVYDTDEAGRKKLRKFEKNTFIYRMAGRDRQKSASYYTPEVLTKCLVKYALKELFKEQLDPLPNDEARATHLLQMTVCEPAMGSAAFINEAINQLADRYLELMQSAKGERIPQSQYVTEKQKVKMYLADNNVFGVDLNPVAVELAEVSIWLNALSKDRFVPWLGLQLHAGNSLIGARRETFHKDQLKVAGSHADSWLNSAPDQLRMDEDRRQGQIWHFLLPDKGMAKYTDRVIRQRYQSQIQAINAWRTMFTSMFDDSDIRRLEVLSAKVEELWQEHTKQLAQLRKKTTDPYDIYGYADTEHKTTSLHFKDTALSGELLAEKLANTSAWRRLKLVMDYWCALWFWPIDQYEKLPSREEWLFDLENLLLGDTLSAGPVNETRDLFAPSVSDETGRYYVNKFGVVNLKVLFNSSPRYQLADRIAKHHRFFHWQLDFADIFHESSGFDLILGNPPWIKIEWQEGGVLGDAQPLFVLRRYSATRLRGLRESTFSNFPNLEAAWRSEFVSNEGIQNYLNSRANYAQLSGIQTNLYKCFLPRAWALLTHSGVNAFLHPETIFDDPKGGTFRRTAYHRLRTHFQFQNEKKLFPTGNQAKYGICVYGPTASEISFQSISNLYLPHTVDQCFKPAPGRTTIPGIKDDNNDWNTSGHPGRIVTVTLRELELFAKLYDEPSTAPEQARLPALHAKKLVAVLEKFALHPRRLVDLGEHYTSTVMFDEAYAQRDRTIRRETSFPTDVNEWVLSGPHFFVANPMFQTPKRVCRTHRAYDVIDLTEIPDDYLPRTNFSPDCTFDEYRARMPKVSWIEDGEAEHRYVTDYYRICVSRGLSPIGERTLQPSIIPRGAGHIDGVFSIAIKSEKDAVTIAGYWSSIVIDFFVKSTGRGDCREDLAKRIAIPLASSTQTDVLMRALRLICVTSHFADLWENCWSDNLRGSHWSNWWEVMHDFGHNALTEVWNRDCAFRDDYTRRQALLEIDVLVAQSVRLSLKELLNIYRIQFPVMRQYEAETYYDQNGRIIFTPSKGLSGVGLPRKARRADLNNGISYKICAAVRNEDGIALGWEDVKQLKEGAVVKTFMDDTLPNGPHERTIEYVAPYFRPDREEDYRVAWEFFEQNLSTAES